MRIGGIGRFGIRDECIGQHALLVPGHRLDVAVAIADTIAVLVERIGGHDRERALEVFAAEDRNAPVDERRVLDVAERSEEHTSELQSLMRISYAVFCLKKKKTLIKYINIDHSKKFTNQTTTCHHKLTYLA